MINKIIVTFCLFFSLTTFAQDATASPYSFYGIGEVKFSGTIENRSMGGLSIFRDSIHMNIQNPASFSKLLFTTFAIGGNTNTTITKSASAEDKSKRTTIDYLTVGLPFGKFGASFGIVPYSSVGYKTQKFTPAGSDPLTDPETLKRYSGAGGLNKVYASLAYSLNKNLSIGFNFNYNFGEIETENVEYKTGSTFPVQYGSLENNLSSIKGINISTGLMFEQPLKGNKRITASLTYTPESKLNFDNIRTFSLVQASSSGNEIVESLESKQTTNTVILPTKFSFGAGFGNPKKWQIGGEIVYQETSKLTNRVNDDFTNVGFENATKYIVGGYFIPKYNSFTNYFQRIVYRAGFNFQNTGLILNNKPIKDQSISIGLGMPLSGTFSNINIGFEMGKKGTTRAGLIQENYTNLSIGLSFNDRWFQKRKFD